MFADEIGADGYGVNASAAVDLFLRLAAREGQGCAWRRIRFSTGRKFLRRSRRRMTGTTCTVQMPRRFQERIDLMAATARTCRKPTSYLAQWKWSEEEEREGSAEEVAAAVKAELEAQGGLVADGTLSINGQTIEAHCGTSLFDCAEGIGIAVPTSCRKQGKCKECIVEVTEGMERLSERTEQERHLQGNFRLSCQARCVDERTTGASALPHHAARATCGSSGTRLACRWAAARCWIRR